jgi:hypothetical protein
MIYNERHFSPEEYFPNEVLEFIISTLPVQRNSISSMFTEEGILCKYFDGELDKDENPEDWKWVMSLGGKMRAVEYYKELVHRLMMEAIQSYTI